MELKTNYGYYNVILWKKGSHHSYYPKDILSFESDEEHYDYLLFLRFSNKQSYSIPDIDSLIVSMELLYNEDQTTFVVLTPRKDAPQFNASEDEYVHSFSCKLEYFRNLTSSFNKKNILPANLLFEVLDLISKNDSEFKKILIRQIPLEVEKSAPINNYSLIIPHRGDSEYLKNVLSFSNRIERAKIYVGIDQVITENLLRLKKDYPDISFFNFTPDPVGPYIIRNRLIDLSGDELIFFQDSDDISCADRFSRIADYMEESGAQLCGSHELCLDYYDRTARSIRYPLDVTMALGNSPWHALLLPSSGITRKAFYDCGKLSEERSFGNDTKFLLNSFFILNSIKNIDEFFYIRKRHPGALTTSPATKIGSTIRRRLAYTWNYDFELIKAGRLKLQDSSLSYADSKLVFEIKKL